MKKILNSVFYGKDAKTILVLALAVLAFAALGCSGSGSSSKNKPVPSSYYGGWSTNDGTTLQITSDGIGHYKSGGTSIDGAAAELDETGKVLKLSFVGIPVKEFQVDQEPKNGSMKLDGVLYYTNERAKNSGKDDTNSSDDDKSTGDSKGVPSDSQLKDMSAEVMAAFANAVETEDFDDFRNEVGSPQFKEQFSNEDMKKQFHEFLAKKAVFNLIFAGIEDLTPTFTSAPAITEKGKFKLMDVSGTYPTKPATKFQLQFIKDTGDWKILGLDIEVEKSK